jgi:microcystin-dependent protein
MPTDANGNYALPQGYLAITGTPILPSQHNPALEDLGEAMTGRLPKNGSAPMTGPLRVVDGGAAQPSITFASNITAGFYKTDGGIGVTIGGTKVAEFTSAGIKAGGRYIGELIPIMRTGAMPLTVQPLGQTLSRATYADLWAVAQTEIAAGNTFYNNGDGSTTFGIGNLRGRTLVMADWGAGVGFSSVIGALGGASTAALSIGNMPRHFHGGATGGMDRANPHGHPLSGGAGTGVTGGFDFPVYAPTGTLSLAYPSAAPQDINHLHPINAEGDGAPFSIWQPSMICNCLLFTGV